MAELNPHWLEEAKCVGLDPELFFPGRGEDSSAARAVCRSCDVRVECLDENMMERMGVYGGVSERERRKIRRLGVTAAEYIAGLDNGTYETPKRGRPAQKVA